MGDSVLRLSPVVYLMVEGNNHPTKRGCDFGSKLQWLIYNQFR
jgi:hypothetical protein